MKFLNLTLVLLALLNNEFFSVEAQRSKIVGGTPTATNQYPYYALPTNGYLCGATLISKDILLSAAHCGDIVFKDGVRIGGNTYFYSTGKKYSVNKTLIHPQYDSVRFLNDIMLIKINGMAPEPYVTLNYNSTRPVTGQMLRAVGHGATSEGGSSSDPQLQVDLPTATDALCKQHYSGYYVNSTMLCSGGSAEGGKDACQGDSGGPLFLQGTDIQVGIISFGRGCARPGVPAVNTRVSAYKQWIRDATCSLSAYPAAHCFATPAPNPPAPIAPAPIPSAPVAPAPIPSAPVVPAPIPSAPLAPAPIPSAPVIAPQPVAFSSPSSPPTKQPTTAPSFSPSSEPTRLPTTSPSYSPTLRKTSSPTKTLVTAVNCYLICAGSTCNGNQLSGFLSSKETTFAFSKLKTTSLSIRCDATSNISSIKFSYQTTNHRTYTAPFAMRGMTGSNYNAVSYLSNVGGKTVTVRAYQDEILVQTSTIVFKLTW